MPPHFCEDHKTRTQEVSQRSVSTSLHLNSSLLMQWVHVQIHYVQHETKPQKCVHLEPVQYKAKFSCPAAVSGMTTRRWEKISSGMILSLLHSENTLTRTAAETIGTGFGAYNFAWCQLPTSVWQFPGAFDGHRAFLQARRYVRQCHQDHTPSLFVHDGCLNEVGFTLAFIHIRGQPGAQ